MYTQTMYNSYECFTVSGYNGTLRSSSRGTSLFTDVTSMTALCLFAKVN